MSDFYEELASEAITVANALDDPNWRDAYQEIASELLTLARASREAG